MEIYDQSETKCGRRCGSIFDPIDNRMDIGEYDMVQNSCAGFIGNCFDPCYLYAVVLVVVWFYPIDRAIVYNCSFDLDLLSGCDTCCIATKMYL